MNQNLPSSENFKELTLRLSLRPLLNLLIENYCKASCHEISDKLDFFLDTGFNKLRNNSTYVCFDNLKSMYSYDVIPENVFLVTCLNANPDDTYLPSHSFLQELLLIVEQIKSNSFLLTHEWYFDYEGNSGIFLHFIKPVKETEYFITIFIAFKNLDDVPTLTQVKNGKK